MKRKRVIITGGLGFIVSHFVEKLVEDNQVVIIDNKSTGKLENVSHLINEDLHVIEGDITIPTKAFASMVRKVYARMQQQVLG